MNHTLAVSYTHLDVYKRQYTDTPFRTYPDGFPESFIREFEKAIGREVIGNYPASGTEIIELLGPEHEATGKPIVYTSADSVFQIAANIDVIPLKELYHICLLYTSGRQRIKTQGRALRNYRNSGDTNSAARLRAERKTGRKIL